MRRKLSNHSQEASVDLTPMLDVVFILLIFFIVTSTFIQEKTIGLEPPPPQSTHGIPSPAMTIYVDENSLIRINGKLVGIGRVRSNLERLRAENPDAPAIILANPLARAGTVIQIRDQVYSAKIDRVNVIRTAT